MKIGLDIRELQTGIMTGIGRYLVNFLHWAIPANPDCHFYLYGNQTTQFDYRANNVTFKKIPEKNTRWWDQVILPSQIKKDRLDVFLSPYIKGPLFASAPVVTTIHDLLFLVLPEYKKSKLWDILYKSFARLTSFRANTVLTDSLFSKEDITRLLKVPQDKIEVIPLSVALEYYRHPSPDTLAKQEFGIERPYILYVGNFKPHKNVRRLVEAYSRQEQNLINKYQLVLCGKKDEDARQLLKLIGTLKLEKRIVFTDMVVGETLQALYCAAELFIFPTLYEGFGLPVIEAMASGTAVISSDVTSVPEVAGDAALLVNPRDTGAIATAMNKLLTDSRLRREYVAKGIKRAQMFHPHKTGKMLFNLLKRVAEGQDGVVIDNS